MIVGRGAGVASFGHFIDGSELMSDASFPSVDPWSMKTWAEVAEAEEREVELAIDSARRAFDEGPWARMNPSERAKVLAALADLIDLHSEMLALADTTDVGRPIRFTLGRDAPRSANRFRACAEQINQHTADVYPSDRGHHYYSRFEPAGVVAVISPWNLPLALTATRVAPALAWGNTIVVKPAPQSPVSAVLLARLAVEAGVPPGVMNVVEGHAAPGSLLSADPRIDRIAFTGASATGAKVAQTAARNLTPVSLECGGKGASLVFADADLDRAVDATIRAAFDNSGQICLAGSRLYVEDKVFDEFLDRYVRAADDLVVGDPRDPETDIGPVVSDDHHARICRFLDGIPSEGGTILNGGPTGRGLLIRPTVVVGLGSDATAVREEIFGPVVVVSSFSNEQEAISLANDSAYGLTGLVFTESIRKGHRVAQSIHAGTVWVNSFGPRDPRMPFGGYRLSGVGREGGTFSRDFYTEQKGIVVEL